MRLSDWRRDGRTFPYRGHDIFYRREGRGDAVLLIHGFPTSSWDWYRIWPDLARRFDVIAADMLGFGFSAKPRSWDYRLTDQATMHELLLAELGVSRVHVLCHDYGVSVGQELLARQEDGTCPVELRSVCFLNGGLFPGIHRPLPIQRLLASPVGPLLAPFLGRGALRRSFHKIFGPATRPTESELDDLWETIDTGDGRRVIPKLMRYMAEREAHRERWVGVLARTSVPLRLINGARDPISGAHVAEHFRHNVPGADVVELADIGHYPQIEAPREVLRGYLELVEKVAGTR